MGSTEEGRFLEWNCAKGTYWNRHDAGSNSRRSELVVLGHQSTEQLLRVSIITYI
jgi:hypothetical protein